MDQQFLWGEAYSRGFSIRKSGLGMRNAGVAILRHPRTKHCVHKVLLLPERRLERWRNSRTPRKTYHDNRQEMHAETSNFSIPHHVGIYEIPKLSSALKAESLLLREVENSHRPFLDSAAEQYEGSRGLGIHSATAFLLHGARLGLRPGRDTLE